jgi:hypothetical protein
MLLSALVRGAVVLLTILLVAGAMTGVALAEPTVSVSVDGQAVSDGETVRTDSDPTVDIEASADSSIELVEVRVNGEIRESYEPASESFSESTTLDLDNGEQDVRIIVNAEETSTFDATILRDGAAPLIEYTSPFRTPDKAPPPDTTTVGDANVTLAGNIDDHTGAETIEIRRVFEYRYGGTSEQSVATHELQDSGESFEQELFLGDGENDIRVRYTDEMGNVRVHEFTLTMDDNEAPTVELSAPERTGAPQVRIRGAVSDNVKLQTVEVQRPDGTTFQPLTERSPAPNPARLSVDINEEVELSEGPNEFRVEATDNAGNSHSESITVVYDRQIEPRITLDADRTGFEDGQLRVRGRVDRGEIRRVVAQSSDPDSEDVIDIQEAYAGDTTSRVDIDQTLAVGDGETRIRIIVTDSNDNQIDETFTVDASTESVSLDGSSGGSTPAQTPTPATESDTETQTGSGDTDGSDGSGGADESGESGGDVGDAPQADGDGNEGGETPGGDGPGFTPVVALVALALVAVRLAVGHR